MQVKVENVEKNVVQLEIEVDSEKFDQGLNKAFAKNASKFNIPGFRRGKAPRSMVEKFYGEQMRLTLFALMHTIRRLKRTIFTRLTDPKLT